MKGGWQKEKGRRRKEKGKEGVHGHPLKEELEARAGTARIGR